MAILLRRAGRKGRAPRLNLLLSAPCLSVSPLFDASPAGLLGRRCGGTLFVPTPSGSHGAQRTARAAPLGATGPEPCAATRRLAWAEHGEHGEDLPLARSEHRGTHELAREPLKLSTAQISTSLNFLISGPKLAFKINNLQGRSQPNGRSIPTKRAVYPNQTGGLSQPNGRSQIPTKRALYPNLFTKFGWIT
jgi:hypothetical protein